MAHLSGLTALSSTSPNPLGCLLLGAGLPPGLPAPLRLVRLVLGSHGASGLHALLPALVAACGQSLRALAVVIGINLSVGRRVACVTPSYLFLLLFLLPSVMSSAALSDLVCLSAGHGGVILPPRPPVAITQLLEGLAELEELSAVAVSGPLPPATRVLELPVVQVGSLPTAIHSVRVERIRPKNISSSGAPVWMVSPW